VLVFALGPELPGEFIDVSTAFYAILYHVNSELVEIVRAEAKNLRDAAPLALPPRFFASATGAAASPDGNSERPAQFGASSSCNASSSASVVGVPRRLYW
jgi:hypothetical protein